MSDWQIKADRLWNTIMETAKFGGTARGGINRLTLSGSDRQVRDWFVEACREVGCAVTIDELGNIFARRPGRDNSLPPVAMGSHLDTQPAGGKFDGIVGVLAGLEVLRTLKETGHMTDAPLEVINWTNEEGSRFAPSMLASGVFAGVYTLDFARSREDREGKKFGEEVERIGYRGEAKCGDRKLGAYFELHIEQGPVLENEDRLIGVVTGVQGMRWYEVTVTGFEGHAGSIPVPMRKDAMLGCARMVEAVRKIALNHPPLALSTVGLVEVSPNSRNVIPGSVFFTVDMRHPEDAVLGQMEDELGLMLNEIAADLGLEVRLENISRARPVDFDETCIGVVRAAAEKLRYGYREMISGPGHDAVYVAKVAPAAMIFIPCQNGISHNEMEKVEPEQVAAGANVLLNAVLAYDGTLSGRKAR